jgi:hypothetical protein
MKIRVLQKWLGRRGVLLAGMGLRSLVLVSMLSEALGAVNVLERSSNT